MRLTRRMKELWRSAYYGMIYGVGNLITFFPLIWRDRDWDWAYLYQLMEYKLRRMAKLQRNYGICVNKDNLADECEEAAELLRRIYMEDYDEPYKVVLDRQTKDLQRFCKLFNDRSRSWWD